MTPSKKIIAYRRHREVAFVGALLSFGLGFGLVDLGGNLVAAGGVPPGFVGHEVVLVLLLLGLAIGFLRSVLLVIDYRFRRHVVFDETHVTIPPCRLWHLLSRRIAYDSIQHVALVDASGANQNLVVHWTGGSLTIPGFGVGVTQGVAAELKRRCPHVVAAS